MSDTRIYIERIPAVGESIWLDEAASHHLCVVLRKKPSERIIVFAGAHEEALAEIIQFQRKKAQINIQKVEAVCRESPLNIHLVQAMAKGDKMDWIVQKATELGVSEITPLISAHVAYEYPAARLSKKIQHWRAISIHAAEQCGRTVIPKVNEAQFYQDFIENESGLTINSEILKHNRDTRTYKKRQGRGALCASSGVYTPVNEQRSKQCNDEIGVFRKSCEGKGLKWILSQHGQPITHAPLKTEAVSVLIGPEGGWSTEELQFAQAKQWEAVSLGPRILRTETASVAMLSVLQYCAGDL